MIIQSSAMMLLLLFFAFVSLVTSIVLDVTNQQSIVNAAALLAHGVQQLYTGNQTGGTVGKWPYPPYYWWESGGAWGGMMQYWAFTGDESYSRVMIEALIAQSGTNYDFMVPAEAFDEGNDDQAFWVFVAMAAAEYNFPQAPAPAPAWYVYVENAWNEYVSRWSTVHCGGGLKWQIYPANAGYFYKNSVSNGAFFQLSARLLRFTGNQTYLTWANTIWNWSEDIGLISPTYDVYDGTDENLNCSAINHLQWTYNLGVYLYGAAMLSNYTNGTQIWVDRTIGLLAATDVFFSPYTNATNIMFEVACEPEDTCNVDQWSMKAYLSRWLATTSIVAPYTTGKIGDLLRASAMGAAAACTSGTYGNTCGSKWYTNGFDGITGLGQQLSAMEVVVALLANDSRPPLVQSQVIIATTILASSTSIPKATGTARPPHDSPSNGVSKSGAITYGGLLTGLLHLLV